MDEATRQQRLKQTCIVPQWPAPASVQAFMTSRQGGVSEFPFNRLNLGGHVGDTPEHVAYNRQLVSAALALPSQPLWLQQVHGTTVVNAQTATATPEADAVVAFQRGHVGVVMTADCLPVLFCDRAGTRVAAAHAGWRGLCAGVLEATVNALDCEPRDIMAWLGAAIGPQAFEVGEEVRSAFIAEQPQAAQAFVPALEAGKYLANMYNLARLRLQAVGVEAIFGGDFCTFTETQRFFSYRRDGRTGRMASLICLR